MSLDSPRWRRYYSGAVREPPICALVPVCWLGVYGAPEWSIWAGFRQAMSGCARGPRDRYACAKSTAFRSGWAGSRPVLPAGGRVEGAEAGLLDDEPELAAG